MCYIRNDPGDRRVIDKRTDCQESRSTEDVLFLFVRLDTECESVLPCEGNLLLSGITVDKDDNCTRIAATSCAWSAWTVDTGNVTEGSHRMGVDRRFQPILLCEG